MGEWVWIQNVVRENNKFVAERQLPAFFYSLPRGSLKTATVA